MHQAVGSRDSFLGVAGDGAEDEVSAGAGKGRRDLGEMVGGGDLVEQ